MRTAKDKAAPAKRRGAFMSVDELRRDHMPDKGLLQVYALATSGVFPFIRTGRRIDLLRAPTLAILAGERPPGDLQLNRPARGVKKRRRSVKKKRPARSRRPAKQKPVTEQAEAAAVAP